MPASNSVVERILSLVRTTAVKTKPRNKIQIQLLEAIIRIRSHLLDQKMCCKDFRCTPNTVNSHNSQNLYISSENVEANYLEEILHNSIKHG